MEVTQQECKAMQDDDDWADHCLRMSWEKTQQLAQRVKGSALWESGYAEKLSLGAVSWRKEWEGIYLSGSLPSLISHWSKVAPCGVNSYTFPGHIIWAPLRVFCKACALRCDVVSESGSGGRNQIRHEHLVSLRRPTGKWRPRQSHQLRGQVAGGAKRIWESRWSQGNLRRPLRCIQHIAPLESLRSLRPSLYILFQIIIWGMQLFFENKMPSLLQSSQSQSPFVVIASLNFQ